MSYLQKNKKTNQMHFIHGDRQNIFFTNNTLQHVKLWTKTKIMSLYLQNAIYKLLGQSTGTI